MKKAIVLNEKYQSPPPFLGSGRFSPAFVLALALVFAGCGVLSKLGAGPDDISVTFASVTADGEAFKTTTSALTLTFSEEIAGLQADDITLSGAEKGELQNDGEGTYTLVPSDVEAEGKIAVGVSRNGYRVSPASLTVPAHKNKAEATPGIKEKFGVTKGGTEGVTAAFNALHNFIRDGGLEKQPKVIKTGDWIDLEGGLAVKAYGGTDGKGGGGFDHNAAKAMEQVRVTFGDDTAPWGRLCRLVVVGVNSFHSGKEGYNGAYTIEENDGTPHVVFQFQHIPVVRRMNAADTSEGGYAASEMREYLTGNFLAGLKNAGVPEGVLWAPKRVLSKGPNGAGSVTLSDKLWLPTEAEMFGYRIFSADDETAGNQAWFEYYYIRPVTHYFYAQSKTWCGDATGYPDAKVSSLYWMGSSADYFSGDYCVIFFDGRPYYEKASSAQGVAPAFCVW
jgi:hypothetical protein